MLSCDSSCFVPKDIKQVLSCQDTYMIRHFSSSAVALLEHIWWLPVLPPGLAHAFLETCVMKFLWSRRAVSLLLAKDCVLYNKCCKLPRGLAKGTQIILT